MTDLLGLEESTTFPDWGKMEFYSYPPQPWEDLLPGASATACDLLDKLVKYQSTERLDAAKVLVCLLNDRWFFH